MLMSKCINYVEDSSLEIKTLVQELQTKPLAILLTAVKVYGLCYWLNNRNKVFGLHKISLYTKNI